MQIREPLEIRLPSFASTAVEGVSIQVWKLIGTAFSYRLMLNAGD